jgi:hypothetical protein
MKLPRRQFLRKCRPARRPRTARSSARTDLDKTARRRCHQQAAPRNDAGIPLGLHFIYQMMFAIIAPALITGASIWLDPCPLRFRNTQTTSQAWWRRAMSRMPSTLSSRFLPHRKRRPSCVQRDSSPCRDPASGHSCRISRCVRPLERKPGGRERTAQQISLRRLAAGAAQQSELLRRLDALRSGFYIEIARESGNRADDAPPTPRAMSPR